jgi:ADP-ribosylglycohydrolase
MNNPKLVNRRRQNSIELGMHTDVRYCLIAKDCSMAKCLAESLLVNNLDLDGLDVRLRYILWWYYGYCNGTLGQPSFGLGSNIHLSLNEFLKQPAPFMDLNGPRQNNGNGGLMRLAPCALVGSHNKESYTQEQVVKVNINCNVSCARCKAEQPTMGWRLKSAVNYSA